MTPEAKQILAQLRDEFYRKFAEVMQRPINLSKDSTLIFNPSLAPIATWLDSQDQFNYLNVYAYTAPDNLTPHRPLTVQISINSPGPAKEVQRKTGYSLNQDWSLTLTVLPEEALGIVHWVASWIHSQGNDSIAIPASVRLKSIPTELANDYQICTQTAWQSLHPEQDAQSSQNLQVA
ncbi:MAG: hypothetical protein HC934_13990 [Acaryochloridaceae cyanobacterium SU_2_1]|nr:hypothetical protein [Acaryochloridaceae cyanobacterium SU_2_1]NJM95183.1 hypothetical protein [Acaryochloridaceae cyanobacterium CSU_5_19]